MERKQSGRQCNYTTVGIEKFDFQMGPCMKTGCSIVHTSLCQWPNQLTTKNIARMPSPSPTTTLLSNAAKQKKILFKVKAQPWDQRPAAFLFIYLYVFYSFSQIFHKQALRWHRIYYRRKNVQGVCIHNIHSLTKSFQI